MSRLQTYNPEDTMTAKQVEEYRVLKDPILKMAPDEAALSIRRDSKTTIRDLRAQVERLTRIVVALHSEIKSLRR